MASARPAGSGGQPTGSRSTRSRARAVASPACSSTAPRWTGRSCHRPPPAPRSTLRPSSRRDPCCPRGRWMPRCRHVDPGRDAMAEIVLEDVWKVYADGTEAVRSLDLDIHDGEFMVLVGPSGCGKTTALRMVAGLEAISKGSVRIGDKVVNDVPPKDRDIAMVFQSYALYPHMSVYDNMGFGLKLQKIPKPEIDQRVRDAARILRLEDFLQRKPKALSGG